jgi:hypothetical protein
VEATTVGTWSQIGYNAPGTQDNSASSHTNNFSYSDGKDGNKAKWSATALHKLNDCNKGTWWSTADATTDSDAGTTYVTIATGGDDACTGLTRPSQIWPAAPTNLFFCGKKDELYARPFLYYLIFNKHTFQG